jgi:hypothetical protein
VEQKTMMDTVLESLQRLLASPIFHGLCLSIVAVAAVLAVLSRIYDDTLSQRFALALIGLGATVQLSLVVHTGYTSPGWGFILAGAALYASATAAKFWRQWRAAGSPNHPLRRSTDRMPLDSTPGHTGPASTAWQETMPHDRSGNRPAA